MNPGHQITARAKVRESKGPIIFSSSIYYLTWAELCGDSKTFGLNTALLGLSRREKKLSTHSCIGSC